MSARKGVLLGLLALGFPVLPAEFQPPIAAAYSMAAQWIRGSELTERDEQRHIKTVLPEADEFSPKEGEPLPYYRGYKVDPATGARTLVGLVFFTIDVEPRERGYESHINTAVALNLRGEITGIKVVEHREPYGYFSVDLPEFAVQFKDKSVLDDFRLGHDIHAIARATMSISSSSRSIRKASRRILKQHLTQEK